MDWLKFISKICRKCTKKKKKIIIFDYKPFIQFIKSLMVIIFMILLDFLMMEYIYKRVIFDVVIKLETQKGFVNVKKACLI